MFIITKGVYLMITWMQKHRKYLVVTIWISTIAFIGAGFVGWGQYSYGDKASAIAKVGDVEITAADLQKSYSRLYNQYNKIFQGNFDQEQAKSFGLEKQAFEQLHDQALIINYANSLGMMVSDQEIYDVVKTEEAFMKNGAFDKDIYKQALKAAHMKPQEYEAEIKKSILLEKTLTKFSPKALALESKALDTALYIADKVEYKIITTSDINVAVNEDELKKYYDSHKMNYMSEPSYELSVITQELLHVMPSDSEIQAFHTEHKHDYTNEEGMLLSLEEAKDKVILSINEKATNKEALKKYIAFKKDKLDSAINIESVIISQSNNPYTEEVITAVKALSPSEFLKPKKVNDSYVVVKVNKINASAPKAYENIVTELTTALLKEKRHQELVNLAKNSVEAFKGKTSVLLTREDISKFDDLEESDAATFLNSLFEKKTKRGYIEVSEDKIVLYSILEQKLLDKEQTDQENSVLRLKSSMFNQGLIKQLDTKYKTELFAKGL